MVRPKHQNSDLEKVLKAAERQGWTVKKRPRGYFKMYCPCAEEHFKTVHLTPGRNYLRNCLAELRRSTCWKQEQ